MRKSLQNDAEMQKPDVIEAIVEALRLEFTGYVAISRKTRSAGNDAQTKAEGKYDTRSIEENYLADGQAKQALIAREAMLSIEALPQIDYTAQTPIGVGALVQVGLPSETMWFFLAPAAGGLEVAVAGEMVTVLSPDSPLGRQLQGLRQGDATRQPAGKILQVS